MKPGLRVFHPAFGAGVVIAVNLTGPRKRAQVDFGYAQPWVVCDALQLLDGDAPKDSTPIPSGASSPTEDVPEPQGESDGDGSRAESWPTQFQLTQSQTEARSGITALRLGQILEMQALELTVGTDDLVERLQQALLQTLTGKPTFLLVDGAWGGGKTHALTLLQALARKEQMTIGSAVMDGNGVTLFEPMQLMETIVGSFRVPGSGPEVGLGSVLRTVKRSGKSQLLRAHGAHEIADALDALPAGAFDDPEALQCIEDYFSFTLSTSQVRAKLRSLDYNCLPPPVLRARWVEERPRAFALLLKCWAQAMPVLGGKGLLVILDELDVEYASTAYSNRASWGRRERRHALLGQLAEMAAHRAPLLVAFGSAPAADVDVENDAVRDLRGVLGKGLIHLKVATPSDADLRLLLAKLARLYQTAYPGSDLGGAGEDASDLFRSLNARYRRPANPVPRQFVRTALEAFDILATGGRGLDGLLRDITS